MAVFTQLTLLILSFICLFLGFYETSPNFETLKFLGCIGLVQLLLSIWSWLKIGEKLISPYIVFLITLYIFSCGQLLLYPFDIITSRDMIGFRGIYLKDIYYASLYTLSALGFFQIGALWKQKLNLKYKTIYSSKYTIENRRLKQIGWLLAIIAAYPYFDELITNAILSRLQGYGAIYQQEVKVGLDNFTGILADYFIPGLLCLFVAYKNSKGMKMVCYSCFAIIILLILIMGGRTEAVILVAIVLIIQNYFIRPFKKRQLVMIAVGGFLFLEVLTIVGKTRNESTDQLSSYTSQDSSNAATDAIGEMGWTMFCLAKTEQLVPEKEDFRFGKSYIYSFFSLVPNVGFWKVHPAKEEANLGDWLTETINLGYGTGYSMVAETYANFGYFGILMMMIFGYIAAAFFGQLKIAVQSKNLAYAIFVLIVFWFALKMPRNSFINMVRALFYYALPIYWYTRGYIFKNHHAVQNINSTTT